MTGSITAYPEALSRYHRIDGPEECSGPPAVVPPSPGDVDRWPVVQLVLSIAGVDRGPCGNPAHGLEGL